MLLVHDPHQAAEDEQDSPLHRELGQRQGCVAGPGFKATVLTKKSSLGLGGKGDRGRESSTREGKGYWEGAEGG